MFLDFLLCFGIFFRIEKLIQFVHYYAIAYSNLLEYQQTKGILHFIFWLRERNKNKKQYRVVF